MRRRVLQCHHSDADPGRDGNSGKLTIDPMPNLSTVNFDHSLTNGGSPGLVPSGEMQLVDSNGAPLATPSSPDSDADGFNVCTYASSCGAPSGS
jgi:hypothetical protein